jgi:hypothetical protein
MCSLSDVFVQTDRSEMKNEAGKILTYEDMLIKFQSMWNVNSKTMSVIVSATGLL